MSKTTEILGSRHTSENISVTHSVAASYAEVSDALVHRLTEVVQLAFPETKTPPFEATLTTVSLRGLLRVPVELEWSRSSTTRGDNGAVMHLTWRPRRLLTLLPVMEADLTLRAEASSKSELTLLGRYIPPFGLVGLIGDRIIGRIALASAAAFLEDLASGIEQSFHGHDS